MKAEMFDKIVEARADQRVQAKIGAFKRACVEAAQHLGVGRFSRQDDLVLCQEESRALFAVLASGEPARGWPPEIWERECEAVRKELLSTMDEFQRALLAAEKAEPGENSPAEEKEAPDAA